ncbi:hypothetical protein [Georgenia sp. Marseille-Q6866]
MLAPTRAATGLRETAPRRRETALGVTAAVVVLLPLLVAGAVGHQVEQVAPGGTDLGGLDVLRHNLRLGLAIGVLGWLTLGVGAAGVAAVGSVASGYVLGAHVADLGWGGTLALVPHLLPELLAFVAFTGAGLHGAVWVWSYVRGTAPARALTRAVLAATAWTAAGTVLLVAAAALESTVI